MRRRAVKGALALGAIILLTGCMAKAPNAQVNEMRREPTYGNAVLGLVTDQMGVGMNPHKPSDRTMTTDILANLTLPSVFNPPATKDPTSLAGYDSTQWQLNETLMKSAEVTSQKPFQVTYRINPAAQWGGSPPVPVEARDFRYLWKVMMRAPGIAANTGYDLITDIESRAGGKTAVVTFKRPYAQWRGLFQNILPSQFLNDIDGLSQLDSGIPYSAGPATVRSADLDRGVITLMPNDKYVVGSRMATDAIRIQRQSTSDQIAEALRSDSVQAGYIRGDSLAATRLNAVPKISAHYVWRPRQLSLVVNQASSMVGGKPELTRALLSLINVPLVAQLAANRLSSVGSGDVPAISVPRHITVSPQLSDQIPVKSDGQLARADAREIVQNSGWLQSDDRIKTVSGQNRALVIGVVRGDLAAMVAASTIADQLTQEGLPAIVQTARHKDLYGGLLPEGRVDMVVAWHVTDVSPVAGIASRFKCEAGHAQRPKPSFLDTPTVDSRGSSAAGNEKLRKQVESAIRLAEKNDGVDPDTGKTVETLQSELKSLATSDDGTAADKPRTEGVGEGSRGPNVSGICDTNLSKVLDDMREATDPIVDFGEQMQVARPYLQEIENMLWSLGVVLPLWQETLLEARSNSIVNPIPEFLGTLKTGIFFNVADWRTDEMLKLPEEETKE
ncbi:MAG TPA: hypothetical protein GX530_01560 [Corynebacteriales bacterium]|nr:hypothetical protein [Mycobacteriales bacterium]